MPGKSPNHALDGDSRVGEIVAILSVASVLSTLAVALRCYCRAFMLRSFGSDDAMIIPAQILTLGSAVAIGLESKYGLGRHFWMMPDEDFFPYMKSFYSSIIVYNVAVAFTKISILLQYRRIFSNTVLRKIIFYGLSFLICWAITLCFLLPLVCVPVAAFWNPDVKGFCLDNGTIWYVIAGVNVVTDFAVFTMPIPVISSLQLPTRQKALLLIVFTLGIFPCAVSIYRIRTLHAAAKSTDLTWDNVDAATFSFLELTVGIIAVCLPTLRPILVDAMPRLFGSLRSSNRQSGAESGGQRSRTRLEDVTNGSRFKRRSTLRESDSTEGLRHGVLELPRSRAEPDLEFGEMMASGGHPPSRDRGYSVTVVGGWEAERNAGFERNAGTKTTTVQVVSQKVSFAGIEEEKERSSTSSGRTEKTMPRVGL